MDVLSTLEELEQLVHRGDLTELRPLAPATHQALDNFIRTLPDPDPPEGLVARPCPSSPAVYHWEQLTRLLAGDGSEGSSRAARAAFHARWILSLAAPGDPDSCPLVGLVVPVFNRAHMVGDAIESGLAQTYRRVEIIVVDDGSTDELDSTLAPYLERIRLVRQPNRGVSNARNRAIGLAQGEYLHFLDSDNVLDPEAVERWIEACRSVGDAELCYSPVRFGWEFPSIPSFLQPPHGGVNCPTHDLMDVVARRHPFPMSGVLLPRWVVLEAGGFDEQLPRGEDTRFWFRLGLRGTKVIGLQTRMNESRPQQTGLNALKGTGEHARVKVLNFLDVQRRPDLWDYLPLSFWAMGLGGGWLWVCKSEEDLVKKTLSEILEELESMAEAASVRDVGFTTRLAAILQMALLREEEQLDGHTEVQEFHRQFVAAVERALASRASAT